MNASNNVLSDAALARIDRWIAKYPKDQKQSAVMAALRIAQEDGEGWLTTEIMDAVAEYLDMPKVLVYEVATFYTMYDHQRVGKHKISVCTNISCQLRGSEEVVQHLEGKLGIKMGDPENNTTEDGNFSLHEVECQGACAGAPMLEVDKRFHENLTIEKIDELLENLK